MKRLMIASALTAATFSGAAFAQEALETKIETFAPNVNYEALSEDGKLTIANIINGGDSFSEKQAKVTSIILDENAMMEDAMMDDNAYVFYMSDDQFTAFENDLESFAPEVEADTLSNDTRLQLMAVMYGGGSHSEKAGKVESILQDS